MAQNSALVTNTGRESAEDNTAAFSAAVQAHVNGDWGGHTQIRVLDELFADSDGDTIPGSKTLRILLTVGNTDIVVAVPVIELVEGAAGDAPSFTLQPTDQEAVIGSTVGFTAASTGAIPLSFQWQKGGVPIQSATSQNIVLTNVQLTSSGSYTVSATNENGLAVSDVAVLTITEN